MAEPVIDGSGFTNGLRRLTPREAEVLARTSRGETNAQVARGLGITVHAVKFHLASVFRKLKVHNRTEAAAVFLQAGPEPLQ